MSYGDKIPEEPIDLLWTNRSHRKSINIARMIYFASLADYGYVNRNVRSAKGKTQHPEVEGIYSLRERWQHWSVLSQADMVMAIGNKRIDSTFHDYQHTGKEVCTIDCGIDVSHYTASDMAAKEPIFIHNATRFSIRKGSHIVAEAWRKVASCLPSASLVLLGREGDVDIDKRLHGVPNVKYLGAYTSGSSEYIAKLAEARWVILPSLAEGQAGTLLEAMSCGCIPLASYDAGVDADKYGGYVIEPNTPYQLVRLMINAAQEWSPSQSERVRLVTMEKHSWKAFEDHILKATEEVLAHPIQRSASRDSSAIAFMKHEIMSLIRSSVAKK
ncbi:MAG: glycosyltransferase family 4 protein [Spirochaetota bacterium]